jgi:hypothetical protein
VAELRFLPLGAQLLFQLGAKAMRQHDLDPHGVHQGQVLDKALQLAGGDQLA